MPFQEGDKEFFRQLAWVYSLEHVKELEQLAGEVLKEQLGAGVRQSIHEIVYNIMEKNKKGSTDGTADKRCLEEAEKESYLAAQAQALLERAASLLAKGEAGFLAGFGPPVVAHLASALNDKSSAVAETAREALLNLEDGGTIDAFCQLWETTRRPELEDILVRKGYLAAKPLALRVLTVLKTGAQPYMLAMNRSTIESVLAATFDSDRQIAARAQDMLLSLETQECIDVFCQIALENNAAKKLLSLAPDGRHAPSEAPRAALFYCLTGQWEKYYAFERGGNRPLLQKGYAEAKKEEKESFLLSAVREGHSRLAAEIILSRTARRELLKINQTVWESMIENIAAQHDREFLAGLILQTPPEFSWKITLLLRKERWSAPQKKWRDLLEVCPPGERRRDLFVPDGREIAVLTLGEADIKPECLAFHPAEPLVAAGCSDGALRFWRLDGSRPWRTITLTEHSICALAFAANGQVLVTAAKDKKVNIWGMPDVTWIAAVKGATGQVLDIAINNAGHILAASQDAQPSPMVRIWHWDGVSMTNKALLPQVVFSLPSVHPGLCSVLGARAGGQICSWPPKSGRGLDGMPPRRLKPLALNISPCGRLAGAVGADACLHIYSIEPGRHLAAMPVRKTRPGGLALSGRGELAAIICPETNTIRIYQARWQSPLAAATRADLAYALKMAEWQNETDMELNPYKYLAALLSAKELSTDISLNQ